MIPAAPAVYVPGQIVPQLPPPEKVNVPLLPITVPVLLKGTLTVLLVPPVISNVPALLNAGAAPPLLKMPFPAPFTKFQMAPVRLFNTAPFCRNREPPPVGFPNVVVPEAFNVRVSKNMVAFRMLMLPFAFVIPVPLIVPPDQVINPSRSTSPVPAKVPLAIENGPLTVSCPLKESPPPLTMIELATELFVTFNGPAETFSVPETFNALMV